MNFRLTLGAEIVGMLWLRSGESGRWIDGGAANAHDRDGHVGPATTRDKRESRLKAMAEFYRRREVRSEDENWAWLYKRNGDDWTVGGLDGWISTTFSSVEPISFFQKKDFFE